MLGWFHIIVLTTNEGFLRIDFVFWHISVVCRDICTCKIKKPNTQYKHLVFSVGVAGFEPATSCSQSRRANRTTLYPVKQYKSGERGIRTPGTLFEYGSLANCWFQPLTHLSVDFTLFNELFQKMDLSQAV